MKIKILPKAVSAISQIVEHVQLNHSKAVALSTKQRILDSLLQITRFPQIGKFEDQETQLRSIVVDGNKILYLIENDLILITNIRPGKTNPNKI